MKKIICGAFIACLLLASGCSKGVLPPKDDSAELQPLVLEKIEPVIPEPPSAQREPEKRTHIIQKGDTLWKIAVQYYGEGKKYPLIMEANGISDARQIKVGQKLLIP